MPKAKSGKAATPDKLAKVGKNTGVELKESELDKASGGRLSSDPFLNIPPIKGD